MSSLPAGATGSLPHTRATGPTQRNCQNRARRRCLLTSGSYEDAEQSRGPAIRRRSAWPTSRDVATGVTTNSSAARLRAELGLAPTRVLATSLLPVGLNWQWATVSRWLPQRPGTAVRAGPARAPRTRLAARRDCVRRWSGSATASAAPRSGPGGMKRSDRAQLRAARSCTLRTDAEQRVVLAGLTPIGPRLTLSRNA